MPDYLASPNAVFGDEGVQWRYGRAPDYSKTRKVWEEGEQFVQCLVVLDCRVASTWSPVLCNIPRAPPCGILITRSARDVDTRRNM